MITHEMIQTFCSDDPAPTVLTKPFNVGNYTYATDGHAAIRIDKRAEYDGNDAKEGIVRSGWMENVPENLWEPLGAFDGMPELYECPQCHGQGQDAECRDCHGDRVVSWQSPSGIEYEEDCELCSGTGREEECDRCDGKGQIEKIIAWEIGSKRLNVKLLNRIAVLPNIQIATEAVEGLKGIPFRFTGGIGIIMPLRKDAEVS